MRVPARPGPRRHSCWRNRTESVAANQAPPAPAHPRSLRTHPLRRSAPHSACGSNTKQRAAMRSARSGGSAPPGPLALRRDLTILRGQRGSSQHPARPPSPAPVWAMTDGRKGRRTAHTCGCNCSGRASAHRRSAARTSSRGARCGARSDPGADRLCTASPALAAESGDRTEALGPGTPSPVPIRLSPLRLPAALPGPVSHRSASPTAPGCSSHAEFPTAAATAVP